MHFHKGVIQFSPVSAAHPAVLACLHLWLQKEYEKEYVEQANMQIQLHQNFLTSPHLPVCSDNIPVSFLFSCKKKTNKINIWVLQY